MIEAYRASRSTRSTRGQALTEFLIVTTLLLIPLLLLIPVIAGLISMKQDVELAARYAVWERIAWNRETPSNGRRDTVKSDAQIAREIDERIFSAHDEPIRSAPRDEPVADDPMWQRPHDGDALFITRDGRRASATGSESAPRGIAGLTGDAIGAFGRFTRFDLNPRGQYDANVSVDVVNLSGWFGLPDVDLDRLRLTRSSRLFTESWTGGPRADVERQISGLLPQQFLDNAAVRNVQDFAAFAPGAREIRSDWLHFGHVDIDPLPAYRVGPRVPSE